MRWALLASLVIQASLGCTSDDPLYCDEATACPPGQRCHLATRTCQASPPDAGGERSTTPAQLGSSCLNPGDCESGFCVDGVCCQAACEGACRSCALPGQEGSCQLAADGVDPRQACGSGPCAGSCREGACAYPAGRSCGDPVCSVGTLRQQICDEEGQCRSRELDCGGYVCASGSECRTSCEAAGDCRSPFHCIDKQCASSLPPGSSCGTNHAACASGHCVDGVCCESSACPACQVCNLSGKGTCSAVTDGTGCGAPTCTAGLTKTPLCQAGSCTAESKSCGLYACNSGGTDCLSACSGSSGCAPAAYCEATICKAKKLNGVTCSAAGECASGICTTTEKVCCDSACAGECETCLGKSSCLPRPAATPCGNQQLTCNNQPASSTITQPRCDGKRVCDPAAVVQSCAPYRCKAGPSPTCASSCAAQADCTTVCDLFVAKSSCRPAAEVCFADAKVCPQIGLGSQASPHCSLQKCLDSGKAYLAAADGSYPENLITKASVQLVSTGTVGPVWNGSWQPRVSLEGRAAGQAVLKVTSGHKLHGFGLEISQPPPSSPAQPSDPSGHLVSAAAGTELTLRTARLHHANLGSCLTMVNGKLDLGDTVMDACAFRAVDTEVTDATLQDVQLLWSDLGLRFDTGKLVMRDVTIRYNGSGIKAWVSSLDLDRVRVIENFGDGLDLRSNSTGQVTNLLAHGNWGKGIVLYQNPVPPTFINVTVAKNGGLEVEGDSSAAAVKTPFYNSILWDVSAPSVSGKLLLQTCQVNLSGAPIPPDYWFNGDPKFQGGSEPYALQPSSPCIDVGVDTVTGLPSLDLVRKPRQCDWIPGGPKVDLGAFELCP